MKRRKGHAAGQTPAKSSHGSAAPTPDALHEAGLGHLRAGRILDAQICCKQALAIDEGHADSLHLMGLLSSHAQGYDHAVAWISRAIRQAPKAEYLASLGTALQRQGRADEALQVFDKAVALRPDDPQGWINLGNILAELKRPGDAVLSFQHALKLDAKNWEAANRAAIVLHGLGRLDEALACFDLCERIQPNHVPTIGARAMVLRDLRRFEECLACNRQAHALDSHNAEICNNLGDALLMLDRLDQALEWFDRALERQPTAIFALENKAAALRKLHRFDELFAVYDRILSIDPANVNAQWAASLDRLRLGDFEAGWQGREARWRLANPPMRWAGPQPVWLGHESIEGKTILIYSDEGLGDAIQFARYVPMLAARGAKVVLVVQDALHALLSTTSGVWQCFPSSTTTLPVIDFCCPINSLPLAFGTTLDTIPRPVGLSAPADRIKVWDKRLGNHDKLRVGLVWSGSVTHLNDRSRSIPLRLLTPLLDSADVTWVSLQKDPRPDDKAVLLERTDIVDLTEHLGDFVETAALISCLDLVITVDTSVAHLSGALGQPTWILLPHTPDHRWLLDRDDSPWYPTMRLFRQGDDRDYAPVIGRVRDELDKLIAARPANTSTDARVWDEADRNATLCFQSGRLQEAVASFTRCIEMRPDHAPTLLMRALALFGLNRFDAAWDDIERAHAHDPGNADICNSAGVILQKLGRYEASLIWFDRAIERQPDYPAAYLNKASSLANLFRFGEAFAAHAQLLAIHPDHPETLWAVALLNLLTGNFEAGWAGREVRWRVPNLPIFRFDFPQPIWLGRESIAGKTVLIHVDEGLGDTIQFVRYVPMVAARGARVILVVADALYPLLSAMPGVAECLPLSNKSLPPFDLYCPIGSLPLAFGTTIETIPSATPYLPPAPRERIETFEQRLGARSKLRVGVVWAGNPKHGNDANRSIALRALKPILDLDATFVSLQKDARPDDKSWLAGQRVIDLSDDLTSFADTAALVSCLDLVISVDTSVAHLAAATGCPTWILLPYIPDYRWLLDRDDSPWYPTAKLFRQDESRDYGTVVERIRNELAALIAAQTASRFPSAP